MSEPKEVERAGAGLAAARQVLSRWRTWLRRRTELDTMDRGDVERLAHDLGLTGVDLRNLAARGPSASHLLYERMHVLGITKADAERTAPGLTRDLERTCSCCTEKSACEWDLMAHPESPAWCGYCPNGEALTAIKTDKESCPA